VCVFTRACSRFGLGPHLGSVLESAAQGISGLNLPAKRSEKAMLWILVVLLLLLAIGGGLVISKFLFLILIVVLIVAAFGARGGRTSS
jgi:hypothetical protein